MLGSSFFFKRFRTPPLQEEQASWLEDLCHQLFPDPLDAQKAFKTVAKRLVKNPIEESPYQKSWILKAVCQELIPCLRQQSIFLAQAQKEMQEVGASGEWRREQFLIYLHRLMPEDQLILLLRDRYGATNAEVAFALELPLGTLKLRRQFALLCLESWLWT